MRCLVFILMTLISFHLHGNQQQSLIDSLKTVYKSIGQKGKAKLCYRIAELQQDQNPDSSLKYANMALQYAKTNEQDSLLFITHVLIGNLNSIYFAKPQESLDHYSDALKYIKENTETKQKIMLWRLKGDVYMLNFGKYETAQDYYLKGLTILDSVNQIRSDRVLQEAHLKYLNSLGSLYFYLRNNQWSLKHFKRAITLSKLYGIEDHLSRFYSNTGISFNQLGQTDSALFYYNKALEIAEEKNDQRRMSRELENIAIIHMEAGDYRKALEYFTEAISIYKQINIEPLKLCFINQNIGYTYLRMGKYEEAYPYLKKGLQLAEQIGMKERISNGHRLMAQYYAGIGDYESAFEIQFKTTLYNDTIYREQVASRTAEMQTKYETAKKEKEIAEQALLIERQQSDIRRQWIFIGGITALALIIFLLFVILFNRYRSKQKQRQSELEKKALELEKRSVESEQRLLRSQMNPHFIFNSLSSVQNYISIDNKIAAMSFLSKFAGLIRNILVNSREATIPLQDEIDTLKLYMELEQLRLKNKFDFKIEVDERLDAEAVYIPPMLIQPFVENAIKHGLRNKEDKGTLEISFRKNAQVIYCKVKDDGIGRDKARQLLEADHRSLALQIIRERLDVLKNVYNAELELSIEDLRNEQGLPAGTRVHLSLPFETEE